MRIAGLVKQSFIDYPDKMACVIFTQGCNFRCGYCHNPSLVLPELFGQNQLIDEQEVLQYLEGRKDWLEGVVITGGEPTIHGDLPDFIKKVKQMGYCVKLDSNGTNPDMLEQLLADKMLDFIAMDIKSNPDAESYSKIIGKDATAIMPNIWRSIKIIQQSGIGYQFRTTLVPHVHPVGIADDIINFLEYDNNFITQQYRDGDTVAKNLAE